MASVVSYTKGKIDQLIADERARGIVTVVAGNNLSTSRPEGASTVYWKFNAGVNIGTNGENVVNGVVGDLFFVADA